MYGIDVSNNNGSLDSIGNAQFVIAKCTEGTGFADSTYGHYAQLAERSRAQFGAYHYFITGQMNARSQARVFMKYARPRNLLSLWVDYELYGASGASDATELALFISTIKLAYPHQKVGIYANETGFLRIKNRLTEIPYDAIWLAAFSVPPEEQVPGLPRWNIHQYTISNGVDQNYTPWSEHEMQEFFTWR
jgi:GH25 family lysozyme M1 (1,4-beta-N-acetylmuramidase)